MDPLDIFAECKEVMSSKFGAVIFLCHCVIMMRHTGIYIWLYFRKSAKLVKVAALICLKNMLCYWFDMDKKC